MTEWHHQLGTFQHISTILAGHFDPNISKHIQTLWFIGTLRDLAVVRWIMHLRYWMLSHGSNMNFPTHIITKKSQIYGYTNVFKWIRCMDIELWISQIMVWVILTLSLPSPSPLGPGTGIPDFYALWVHRPGCGVALQQYFWAPWGPEFLAGSRMCISATLNRWAKSQAVSDPWDLSSLYQQKLNKNLMSSLNWSLVRHFTGRLQDFLFLSALSRVNDDFLAQTPRSPCWIFHPFEKERMRSPVALIQVGLPSDTSQIHEVSVLIDSKGRNKYIYI